MLRGMITSVQKKVDVSVHIVVINRYNVDSD